MATKTENAKFVTSLPALSRNGADADGAAADWSGVNEVEAICDVGAIAGGGDASFYLQQSDLADFSDAEDIDVLDSIEDIPPEDANIAVVLYARRVASSKKYVRVHHDSTGVVVAGAVLRLGSPKEAPVS